MTEDKTPIETAIAGLKPRAVGPAFMGGRIADIAVHPTKTSTWYVAVGSGGVWKTTNAGTTWTALFEDQDSYSIGCVTLDPNNPEVIWVGSGEAVSGRHVGWGHGVYQSRDAGATWANVGLAGSEHIGDILIDPRNSDVIYVAAEGPLWSSGGERGVYKSTNGGTTWHQSLAIDADTGVTSIAFAPDDPDVIYAAAYQRRRRVWSFLGGGSGSGIYKSTDGGTSWRRMSQGLPADEMGKIGLAVTPANPDLVYATIEANDEQKGFYRSTDRGESWERRNEYISGGTGPHYYQEIFASPTDADLVYQVDVFVHVTRDGGETIGRLETGRQKHSDNHVVWIDPDDGQHLLIGTDAGLYETFDQGKQFRHFPNLPISQFYRVAADNAEPFYNLLCGAQDLGTLYGPARTTGAEGVRNQDWSVTLGADGYHVAFDPEDPAICYMEEQNGNVYRLDMRANELQDIKPMPADGDPPERWNWDCPIVVSPHSSTRIYVASQRVWQSDDRGESWTAISGDLTRDQNRYELPANDRVESVDALWDHMAMSQYGSITHLSESPVQSGLLYVGTDDGLIQVTEDAGQTWRVAGELPDFAADGFINNVKASEHSADVVFAVADAHKNGDYSPYVFTSHDRGRTWQSISGDLPMGTIVWSIEQDHVVEALLIAGTEYGISVSLNAGQNWHRLSNVPTIPFRDVKLHRRDDDVVAASFGRGVYVLDDYSTLRELDDTALESDAQLFSVRDAWWFEPQQTAQAPGQPTLGSTAFRAPNPDVGAMFTYWLKQDQLSAKEQRRESEKALGADEDIDFPGWETLWDEHVAAATQLFLVVRDQTGSVVRRVPAETKAGLHRSTWDMRLPAPNPASSDAPKFLEPWESEPRGPLVAPGTYTVELIRIDNNEITELAAAQSFVVRPTPATAAHGDPADTAAFSRQVWDLHRQCLHAAKQLKDLQKRAKEQSQDLAADPNATRDQILAMHALSTRIESLDRDLNGDPTREALSEPATPSVLEALGRIAELHWRTTQPPTQTQRAVATTTENRAQLLFAELGEIASEF